MLAFEETKAKSVFSGFWTGSQVSEPFASSFQQPTNAFGFLHDSPERSVSEHQNSNWGPKFHKTCRKRFISELQIIKQHKTFCEMSFSCELDLKWICESVQLRGATDTTGTSAVVPDRVRSHHQRHHHSTYSINNLSRECSQHFTKRRHHRFGLPADLHHRSLQKSDQLRRQLQVRLWLKLTDRSYEKLKVIAIVYRFREIRPAPPLMTIPSSSPGGSCCSTDTCNHGSGSCTSEDLRARPFVCSHPGCGKAYMKNSHLRAHVRTHTGYCDL